MKEEYGQIKRQLEELCTNKEITEYTKSTIEEMSNNVLENLARKYENVKEGVKDVMVGQVLDYEAKRIRNEGIEKGIEELVQNMLLENTKISFIVKVSKMPEEKVQNIKDKLIKEGKLKELEKGKESP